MSDTTPLSSQLNSPANRPLAVVKVGGDILLDQSQRQGLAFNIKNLIDNNWNVIVLHGGGPQVNHLQSQLGKQSIKVMGRRITKAEDLTVVKQAIAGEVNVNLVSALIKEGVNAFGCHGASGQMIKAVRRAPMLMSEVSDQLIDFGEVGDVVGVNQSLLKTLICADTVPVIATLGIDCDGNILNINADTTVVNIAEAMSADMLLLVTAVGAIYRDIDDKNSRIASLNSKTANEYISQEIIQGGMVPKVEEAFSLIEKGIDRVVILSAVDPDAFASVAKGENNFGTVLY